jgi:hypothetical protein
MFTIAKTGKRPSIEIECTLPEPAKGARRSSATAVPRVARRLALAIRLQKLVDAGEATSDTVLEGIAGASRTRVSHLMALLNLSPDLQESILFLKADPPREKDLRAIAREVDWTKQRKLWCDLIEAQGKS